MKISQAMETATTNDPIKTIFDLYKAHGDDDYIGEDISQLEHAVQAAELAEEDGQPEEVILAALFHDLGHLLHHLESDTKMMGDYGVEDHEGLAAKWLRERGFSEDLCKLVATHVLAKRYLCFKNPRYYEQLSEASMATLEYQGGVMNEQEAADFEADPLSRLIIKMRTWDEQAKVVNKPIPHLGKYEEMARRHLG